MNPIGTKASPAIVKVKTMERASEILKLCLGHDWKVTIDVEASQTEDISDLEALLHLSQADDSLKAGQNTPCA